ncbi:MAG: DUF3482 domain-containing protein [Ketobacter sp.]|nr:MAG: DUF3482 domain-containing protein [Ketobacter sp.]
MRSHPLIAIVGHPNEGKSSVLSTLTEDDSVVVNDYPGETVECQYFPVTINGEVVLELVDTPGFQNPVRILQWMQSARVTDDVLLQAFLQEFSAKEAFHHDCELMQPLLQGAALIYVVDCSRPLLEVDQAEMEILRLINKPRMAVINFKEDDKSYIAEWKQAFRRHFNVIREFNAHQARFQERLALLQTLKAIHQDWEQPIDIAIDAFQKDWNYRLAIVAEYITNYLEFATQLKVAQSYQDEADADIAQEKALEEYHRKISGRERDLFEDIRKRYRHNVYDLKFAEQDILREDLFADKTWELLGLSKQQLTIAATGMGAGLGATLDLATVGLSHGFFTAMGALMAGGSVFLKGSELARVRVKRLPLGGTRVIVGPNRNPQFPLVLLDRAILFFREVSSHAHGNRITENSEDKPQGALQQIEVEQQKKILSCLSQFDSASSGKRERARADLVALLKIILPAPE